MNKEVQTKQIEAHNMYDFLLKSQEAILEGYRLDDSNDFAPRAYPNLFVTTLVKSDEEPVQEKKEETVEPKKAPVKRTTAKKAQAEG